MRKHVIPVLVIFSVLAMVFFLALNTTYLATRLLPGMIQKAWPGVALHSLAIKEQSFRFPDSVFFHNVSFVMEKDQVTYQVRLDTIRIHEIVNIEEGQKHFRADIDGLDVDGGLLRLVDYDLKLILAMGGQGIDKVDGVCRGTTVEYGPYRLEDVEARLKGAAQKYQFYEISANAYGGVGGGQITFELPPAESTLYYLEAFGMKPEALRAIGPGIFSDVDGEVAANCRIIEQSGEIALLAVSFALPKGGTIGAPLLERLLPLLEQTGQTPAVRAVLEAKGRLPVDRASFQLNNMTTKSLLLSASLENKAVGLDFKGTDTLSIPQGLTRFVFQEK